MSRHGTLLPIPEGSELAADIDQQVRLWPAFQGSYDFPRAAWLSKVEAILFLSYPQSRSADRTLTARHYAPFPLALGPNVP